jgi:hypothetical protein
MIEIITNLYYEYYNDINFTNTIIIFFSVSVIFNIIAFFVEFKTISIYTTILPIVHTIVSIIIALIVTIILDKTITPYFNLNYVVKVLYLVSCYAIYIIVGIARMIQSEKVGIFNFFDLLYEYTEYKIIHKANIKEWNNNYNLNINYVNNFLK